MQPVNKTPPASPLLPASGGPSHKPIDRKAVDAYPHALFMEDRIRNSRIDSQLTSNGLQRGTAASLGNNCLLYTLFQQISYHLALSYDLQLNDVNGFIEFMRKSICRLNGGMLSINDEAEGKALLASVQQYLFQKTGTLYRFDLLVLFADNDGEVARIDMDEITQGLTDQGDLIPLWMIQVNYNHYEPLFKIDDGNALAVPLAALARPHSPLPGYVINMPVKVYSDDEGDSSDEEANGFPEAAFQDPHAYFRLLPEKKNKKSGYRGKIVTEPLPNEAAAPASAHKNPISDVLRLCELAAVELNGDSKDSRLSICLGFNKMRSLSRRRNRCLTRQLNSANSTKMPLGKIAFLWDGVWQKKTVANVWVSASYEEVRRFYRQLKRRGPTAAKIFRECAEENRGHMVPYREIRDAIKNHGETERLVRVMRAANAAKAIFLTILDDDFLSLRRTPGSLSFFEALDRNYLQKPFEIGSTGYTINRDNPLLWLSVMADLTVRYSTVRHVKAGVYYPEPCTAIKVPASEETVPENFSDGTNRYTSPQEMPRLIAGVLDRRKLSSQDSMCFDMSGAIVTTTPARFKQLYQARHIKSRHVILWGLADFKTMSATKQSHFNGRDWALNLLPALSLHEAVTIGDDQLADKKVLQDVMISLLSRLFNLFNPIKIAKLEAVKKGCFQTGLIEILKNYSKHLTTQVPPFTDRKTTQPRKKVKDQQQEKIRCRAINALWKWADSINSLDALVEGLTILLAENSIKTSTIVEAAKECGINLTRLFKEHLCLDYVELITGQIADLLDIEDQLTFDEFYLKIMRGFTVESGLVLQTKTELKKLQKREDGLTPLHVAALAGNLPMARWLLEVAPDEKLACSQKDWNGLTPIDYALRYCRNNGLLLDLLSCCWRHLEIMPYLSNQILEELDDDHDILEALERLLENKGKEAIQIATLPLPLLVRALAQKYEVLAERLLQFGGYPESLYKKTDDLPDLFIQALLQGYNELAEGLAEYDDYSSAVYDEMLDDAPNIDETLLTWVMDHGEEDILADIREDLKEAGLAEFERQLDSLLGGNDDTASDALSDDDSTEDP